MPMIDPNAAGQSPDTRPSTEHLDVVQDIDGLVRWLMTSPRTYIFGGLLKHIICPKTHAHFTDIDLIAIDAEVMARIRDTFGYAFREVSRRGNFPRYFIGKSPLVPKTIQLILMRSHAEAMQFTIDGPQYDLDRATFGNGRFYFDPAIGEEAIRHAIKSKRASLVNGPRNMDHFAANRARIEQRHRLKLMLKGFTILDLKTQ